MLNQDPGKFQFCRRTVKFAGFLVKVDSVEPLQKFLGAIAKFPTLRNKTDQRSFNGMVNQVSH